MRRASLYSTAGLGAGLSCVVIATLWHLSVGAKELPLGTVIQAFIDFDPAQFNHIIVRELRLPRALTALLVGASLAVAGSLMQGITRNPLADPGLLGLMSGASLAVVLAHSLFGYVSPLWLPLIAAVGALLTALLVWMLAANATGGLTPMSLTIVGATISALMAALISILHLLDQTSFEALRGWLVGSTAASTFDTLAWVGPWLVLGLGGAILLAPSLSALSMGDEQAVGLGISVKRRKVQLLVCVVILTASSVALAGPLGFIGLVIPHIVRLFIGADYRWLVPYAALFGATYLLGVDIIARTVIKPQEIATGLITALIGAPLLVYLVKTRL